jgi:UDP:flavonoid glycosyltransferase YjiC (YdhE family)
MRVLVTTTGGGGHFGPLIPFATALREAGDDVLVATRAANEGAVAPAGFPVTTFADAPPAARGAVFASLPDWGSEEANRRVVADVFGRLDAPAALPGVLAACDRYRPDLVLSEAFEFAGPLAAEALGLPAARVGIGSASMEQRFWPATAEAFAAVRGKAGLAPDPSGARLAALPCLTLAPPALDEPSLPGLPGLRRYREPDAPRAEPLPDWWPGDERPLVYLTLGSVSAAMGFFPGVYRAAIDALAGLPLRLLVTAGRAGDPAELGALPANVHAERWVPQADVMPHAAAMVCHGGFGTVRAGLAAGVPLAVLPLFADQPFNAGRVAALGAGLAIEGGPAGVAGLRGAVERLLAEGAFAARAAAVAAEIARLPRVDAAVPALHALSNGQVMVAASN